MRSQTSLVATQIRLQQWAEDIHACQNRPADMKIEMINSGFYDLTTAYQSVHINY